jgi:ribosomal protein L11 methyltransferase
VKYMRLAVTPSDSARRDAVSGALFAAGAEGLLEDGARLVTVFATDILARAAERAVRDVDSSAETACEEYDPGDWMEGWRRGVTAHRVGRIVVTPPWEADMHDGATTVVIDPAMGFGTGEHETTRISLLLMQDVVRSGDFVADVGSGSGVLAIAAAKLGASRAAAVEIDPLAIENAEENVARNAVGDRVSVIEGDAAVLLPLLAPVRVVVANIIASVLLALLPVIDRALEPLGDVIVGGLLGAERDGFVRALAREGWRVVREEAEGDWWGAHLRRDGE